jgi:hypothetical protein
MNPMTNTILILEKELELEHQGMRRTRRYIGDAPQVSDPRWYQRQVTPVSENDIFHEGLFHTPQNGKHRSELNQTAENLRKARRSFLANLFHLPRAPRQPACDEC